jgi:RNA polymerase sigma factor (sigma-70 family)
VLQETLEQAWRNLGTLKEVSAAGFHRWLAGIARHRVTDLIRCYRQPRRDVNREELWPSSFRGAAPGNAQTPSKAAARREQWAKIADVLDELNDTYRAVITHRILEGCTTEELAEIVGRDRHAVRVTLYRVLVKLRTLLDERGIKSTIFRPL